MNKENRTYTEWCDIFQQEVTYTEILTPEPKRPKPQWMIESEEFIMRHRHLLEDFMAGRLTTSSPSLPAPASPSLQ